MAFRFYYCLCGEFATIDMFAWITGDQKIECRCGRVLRVNDSFFGFTMDTSHEAWREFIRKEYLKEESLKLHQQV